MGGRLQCRALCWIERALVLLAVAAFGTVSVDFVRAQLDSASAREALQSVRSPAAPVALQPETTEPLSIGADPPGDVDTENASPPESSPAVSARVLPAASARILVGELQIPRVDLSAVVYDVRDPATLRRAAGHLRGTALPWQPGNSVVAGHRDSAFRLLRHVRPGDDVRFVTARGAFDYQVTRAFVVYPHEVWVLKEDAAALTLITCFPFRWVGTAPERWVIQARRLSP